jgi:hypothetical protein
MKITLIRISITVLLLATNGCLAWSQSFTNLDFEHPILPLSPVNFEVPAANAIPGWTAYLGGNPLSSIGYDTVSLGGAAVFLQDTTNNVGGLAPLQGLYSVLLEGSTASTPTAASIGQSGRIPLNALSLTFLLSLNSSLQVTFNGQLIPLVQTGSTPNYDIMGGDTSAIAGQTGQLLFTALPGTIFNAGYGLLDNIQFSTQAIPEPGVFGLFGFGALLLGWRLRHKTR